MSARDDLIRGGLSHQAATDLLIEHHRDSLGYEEALAHPDGWSIWTASFVHSDGEMDMGLDTANVLAKRDAKVRAEVLAEADTRLAAMKMPEYLLGTFNAGTYRDAWLTCREVIAAMGTAGTEEKTTTPVAAVTPQPEAEPVPLRWGLDDVMYGDDDTTTILLSGPTGDPYWLELDPERTAVLRGCLAGPDQPETTPDAARRAVLRTAIADWQGEWTVARAFHFYQARGISNGQRSQARYDLKDLFREGALVLNDQDPARTFYTFNSWNGSTR